MAYHTVRRVAHQFQIHRRPYVPGIVNDIPINWYSHGTGHSIGFNGKVGILYTNQCLQFSSSVFDGTFGNRTTRYLTETTLFGEQSAPL